MSGIAGFDKKFSYHLVNTWPFKIDLMKKTTVPFFDFHPALDADFLHDLFADDPTYTVVVFEGFMKETPQCWDEIKSSFEGNSVAGLKAAVHKCRSLFAYVGLRDMAAQLEEIEAGCATTGNTSALQPALERLFAERKPAEAIIKEEIKRLQAFYESEA